MATTPVLGDTTMNGTQLLGRQSVYGVAALLVVAAAAFGLGVQTSTGVTQADVTDLETSVDDLSDSVEGLDSSVSSNANGIATLEERLANTQDRLDDLEAEASGSDDVAQLSSVDVKFRFDRNYDGDNAEIVLYKDGQEPGTGYPVYYTDHARFDFDEVEDREEGVDYYRFDFDGTRTVAEGVDPGDYSLYVNSDATHRYFGDISVPAEHDQYELDLDYQHVEDVAVDEHAWFDVDTDVLDEDREVVRTNKSELLDEGDNDFTEEQYVRLTADLEGGVAYLGDLAVSDIVDVADNDHIQDVSLDRLVVDDETVADGVSLNDREDNEYELELGDGYDPRKASEDVVLVFRVVTDGGYDGTVLDAALEDIYDDSVFDTSVDE